MALLALALRSLWNRRSTALLTVFSLAVSVALLLGVQKLRVGAKESFENTISGVHLIVGARSGALNLLLYSVFRVGDATANVSWASYRKIAVHPDVEWTIPLSLGDSHRGYRVLGTSLDYFRHYRYAGDRALEFASGQPFADLYDVVLGAEVAERLGYSLGSAIIVAHGLGRVSFSEHADKPFRVVGILRRTGTPVDRTVHVSLEAITAIHLDWQGGVQAPPWARVTAEQARAADLTPDSITAFLLKMKEPALVFTMQRSINNYRDEPLTAVIPGVALKQLWDLVGIAEMALTLIAVCVVLAGLLGMLTAILTTLNERRREMAIIRSVGAAPRHVFALLIAESGLLALCGVLAGVALTYGLLLAVAPLIADQYGIFIRAGGLTRDDVALLALIVGSALVLGVLPAWRAYRHTLADGLSIRV
ncbi:MAG: ABC transporter permease [Steroidobacteraceae bacterium]|nr:ABC transporter permease [Steroidobacteraceae bacterium]MDW8258432.1 FtsX-like permease family protein [Gammaproteobacteria bacterium]